MPLASLIRTLSATSDGDLTAIGLELHHPTEAQGATTFATDEFAKTKKYYSSSTSWIPAALGDEAFRSPEDPSSLDQSHVLLRVQNVVVLVSTATGDEDKASVSTLSAEQHRRAWRVASDLARSLTRLRR